MTAKIDSEVNEAWQRLTSDNSEVSWITCGYNPSDKNNIQFKEQGAGGLPEFLSKLGDELVWGAFKVVGVDDRGNTVSRRPKYIFVKYSPTTASVMARASMGRHKGAMKLAMTGAHIDIEIESKEELTEELIIQKLRAAGGAHQPTGYEFSNFSK
eukprot:gene4594-5036_t